MNHFEPTSSSNEELPRRRLKAVGPMGRSAGLPVGPPTFSFLGWDASGVYLLIVVVWALVQLVFFSGGPSDPCEAHVMMFDRAAFAPQLKRV